ncbi:MAG: hypothetical protein SVO01_08565 [Thermotogota bacterium]|nr:hypothetical protein [Thermotogota bacterium]
MKLETQYPDLAPIVKGASFNQLFQLFWMLAQVRYATRGQLNAVNSKLGTAKKLHHLFTTGYLSVKNGVHSITRKTLQILHDQNYVTAHIQQKLQGGGAHELSVTDAVISEKPDFVLFPSFKRPPDYFDDFLIPDACLIHKFENGYQIQFLEVENPKGHWEDYLSSKKVKYEVIANDYNLYDKWWRLHSERLGLQFPEVDQFKFTVLCYSKLKFDWPGWSFNG